MSPRGYSWKGLRVVGYSVKSEDKEDHISEELGVLWVVFFFFKPTKGM